MGSMLTAVYPRTLGIYREKYDVLPESAVTLAEVLGLYAHHGRHHTGQIEWLRKQHGWGN